ncbi:MAG: hypothetical protein FJY97_00730 [candidate division Zixibacteria bacterium]|nr:hypothetical protein [candidate division Zixibacteria bacterium]
MDIHRTASQISVVVEKSITPTIFDALKSCGITHVNMATGRRALLQEPKGIMRIVSGGSRLLDDPINIVTFLVSPEDELPVLDLIIQAGELDLPGRGSVYAKSVTLLKAHERCIENDARELTISGKSILSNLAGICCIVQKGEGEAIGRIGLDTGTGVPAITFGVGTGVRDKLGLWRVTVPAEKEIIEIVTDADTAHHLMDIMIDIGYLARPGKGFIYQYPVGYGLLNTRYSVGTTEQAASIAQIVSAIDQIQGSTGWRKREFSTFREMQERKYLENLLNFVYICDKGRADFFTGVAMEAGAAGATISQIKYLQLDSSGSDGVFPAREAVIMIVAPGQVETIAAALEDNGAFGDQAHGQLLTSPVTRAYTYIPPKPQQ